MLLHEMTSEILRTVFSYDGCNLVWSDRPDESFHSTSSAKRWRGKNLGNVAGAVDKKSGYRLITFRKKTYLAHRVVWAFFYGPLTSDQMIDHIDGDRSNNRITNLRICSNAENQFNSKKCSKNTSGIKGVSYYSLSKKWAGEFQFEGKKFRRLFIEKGDAEKFVIQRREEVHKEFANHGHGSVLLTKDK